MKIHHESLFGYYREEKPMNMWAEKAKVDTALLMYNKRLILLLDEAYHFIVQRPEGMSDWIREAEEELGIDDHN